MIRVCHVVLLSTNDEYDITVDDSTLQRLIKDKVVILKEEEKDEKKR